MSHRFLVSIASIVFFVSGVPAHAHHAFSNEYDEAMPITLEGVVTRVDWENPHVHYYVDVAQADGTVVNWSCETGGPNRLLKRGWTRDTLKIGDKVTVHGFPAKDASHSADGRRVTLPNGQTLAMGPNR
jgi:hypothetical protein